MTQTLVEDLEQCLLSAIRRNDANELDHLLHPDLIVTNQMGQVLTKSMDLDVYRSKQMKLRALIPSEQEIWIHGDTAVVSVHLHLAGSFAQESFEGDFRYTRVWKRFGTDFQVITSSCVQLSL